MWWSPEAWVDSVRSRTAALDTGQCFCLQHLTDSEKKLPVLAAFQWNCKQLWHKITFCNLSFVIVTINSATYASVNVCLERIHSKQSMNIWFNSKGYKAAEKMTIKYFKFGFYNIWNILPLFLHKCYRLIIFKTIYHAESSWWKHPWHKNDSFTWLNLLESVWKHKILTNTYNISGKKYYVSKEEKHHI